MISSPAGLIIQREHEDHADHRGNAEGKDQPLESAQRQLPSSPSANDCIALFPVDAQSMSNERTDHCQIPVVS